MTHNQRYKWKNLISAEADSRQTREEARYGLSQWQLMWRKFKRSKAAIIGGIVVILLLPDRRCLPTSWRPTAATSASPSTCMPRRRPLHFDFETGLYVNGLDQEIRPGNPADHLQAGHRNKVPDPVLRP